MANREQYKTVREFVKTSLKEVSLDATMSAQQGHADGNGSTRIGNGIDQDLF